MKQWIKIISSVIILLIIIVDMVFLNWKVLEPKQASKTMTVTTVDNPVLPSRTPEALISCPQSCLSKIHEATASLKLPAPVPQQTEKAVSPAAAKEFFVPLGSGSTRADDWEDIAGLAAYIDSSKYGKIKSVVFEAAVSIPNGNQGVYVRLYNATDKHPVWFSDVYHEGGTPKLLISSPITLDSGNKLYQVQMKTTLKDLANLNQSRIKITTE